MARFAVGVLATQPAHGAAARGCSGKGKPCGETHPAKWATAKSVRGRLLWGGLDRSNPVEPQPHSDVPDTKPSLWTHRRTGRHYSSPPTAWSPSTAPLRPGVPRSWDARLVRPGLVPGSSHEERYTHVPIQLEAAGSIFVIFRILRPLPPSPQKHNGETVATTAYTGLADTGALPPSRYRQSGKPSDHSRSRPR
jgi:hypothetical protein